MIYHRDIGFPKNFRRPVGRAALAHSRHALRQSTERGIKIPTHIDFRYVDIIEVGIDRGRLNHLLVRMCNDHENDLCMALAIEYGKFITKTVWLNGVNDLHSTLDRSKYSTP